VLSAAAASARAAVSPSVGGLPRTGSTELVLLAAAGAGLFATGAGVLLSVRRRRGRLV
jgi:LPXTG-motif cell wall-anchored protein